MSRANTTQAANRRTLIKLTVVAVVMFGFAPFVLPPLYRVFCEITGVNLDPGQVTAAQAELNQLDESRLVTIEFVANTDPALPWQFKPKVQRVQVHPGQLTTVNYYAQNLTSRAITGQARPSVTPPLAAKYFKKIECFCFTQQTLEATQSREMPVRFVVESALPPDIGTITLGYTFFSLEPALNSSPQEGG